MGVCGGDDNGGASDTTVPSARDESAGGESTPSSSAPSTSTDSSSSTAEVGLTASYRGVTENEIFVGVAYPDLEAIRDVISLDHGDYEAAVAAVIDELNDRGGIHGRMVTPVFAAVSPIGTASADEACVKLTEDEELFAVVGFFFLDAVLCYVVDHGMATVGGDMTDERLADATAPWYTILSNSDNAFAAGISAVIESGALDGATVAVVADVASEAARDGIILPALQDAGIGVAETAVMEDTGDDVQARNANVSAIAERLKVADADTVVFVGPTINAFIDGIAETDYRPRFVGLDLDTSLAYSQAEGNDLSLLTGMVTAGAARLDFEDAGLQVCFDVIEAATPGLEIVDTRGDPDLPEPWVSAAFACNTIGLFATIAERAGADLTYDTLRAAGDSLGEYRFVGGELRNYSAESPDGAPTREMFAWDPESLQFLPLVGT